MGLKPSSGRKLTAKGVQPRGKVPWPFKATALYGVVAPATGEHCFYEFTHRHSECFQVFLALVSEPYNDSLRSMPLDQAGAHRAKRLQRPPNIILLCQPSHAPATNPIERVWQQLKLGLRWQLPKHLEAWRLLLRSRLEAMTPGVIAAIGGWHSMRSALSVAGI